MKNLDNIMNLDSDIYRRRFRYNISNNINLDPKLNTLDAYKHLNKVRNYSRLVDPYVDEEESKVTAIQYETQTDIVYTVKAHQRMLFMLDHTKNKNDHG